MRRFARMFRNKWRSSTLSRRVHWQGKKIVVFGGSFNPPHKGHVQIVHRLVKLGYYVVVVPCGRRTEKDTTNSIEPIHRAILCDKAFAHIPNVEVYLDDLERAVFTRTMDLDALMHERYPGAKILHAFGADNFVGGKEGKSVIQTRWHEGERAWQELSFLVFDREGSTLTKHDLPPKSKRIIVGVSGSSTEVRERRINHKPIDHLVTKEVNDHILLFSLYAGLPANGIPEDTVDLPRVKIVFNEESPKARAMAKLFEPLASDDPEYILVFGGDGFMLSVIRKYWRLRLPFLGINAGNHGGIMNAVKWFETLTTNPQAINLHHLPLLFAEGEREDGTPFEALAFNDAWVERATGQTGWVKLLIDGKVAEERVMCDAMLAATSAGTQAYATSMGAQSQNITQNSITIAASAVFQPPHWEHGTIDPGCVVDFHILDPAKRPMKAFVDGVEIGRVKWMRMRESRIASVVLVFDPREDLRIKRLARRYSGFRPT